MLFQFLYNFKELNADQLLIKCKILERRLTHRPLDPNNPAIFAEPDIDIDAYKLQREIINLQMATS